ncbi:tRNA nucleotidyltransferase [Schizosaccharomyces japonicus yFS275]|uniref:tRNA nucleotidyltransferase n=1 Tax=Schizosaccharomyces japonicus (strain yFS275 / FY16936) TaxID=402676 RepID=B6K224_SCHJY|nr:tRNA nucleotidyltransferase [Schizosaccharomyces japonicus yFS275]EEB07205.2 tRNA nucleotidyltransferase [Schizosaccharomyces japonicus yFS275]
MSKLLKGLKLGLGSHISSNFNAFLPSTFLSRYYKMSHIKSSSQHVTVALDDTEIKICNLLDAVSRQCPENKTPTLRIAGGWVRDKLLSIPCHDIDVAVDCMSGFEFAQLVHRYCEQNNIQNSGRVVRIDANPSKSKHLETATGRLFGIDVDFVGLRSHAYTHHSEENKFGTPLEDALRRDTTINSLFYNIHTRSVEDFTEMGLEDLEKKVIQTPLPAMETFSDDALRAVRCIRFASKFQFSIHPETQAGIQNPAVQHTLLHSISRERIGTEVEKMLKNKNAKLAVDLSYQLHIADAIFGPLPDVQSKLQGTKSATNIDIFSATSLFQQLIVSDPAYKNLSVDDIYMMWLAIAFLPWRYVTLAQGKQYKTLPYFLAKESLKLGNSVANYQDYLYSNTDSITDSVNRAHKAAYELPASFYGVLIRSLDANWKQAILWAQYLEFLKQPDNKDQVKQKYMGFFNKVQALQLENAYQLKPVLNGKQIASLLKIKAGPQIKDLLSQLIEWQFDHTNASIAECEQFVKGLITQ